MRKLKNRKPVASVLKCGFQLSPPGARGAGDGDVLKGPPIYLLVCSCRSFKSARNSSLML
jgi:hypothetical protein